MFNEKADEIKVIYNGEVYDCYDVEMKQDSWNWRESPRYTFECFINKRKKPYMSNMIKGIYPQPKKKMVVVKFKDNTIIKVKCQEEDEFDVYIGVALAYSYKSFGSNSQFRKFVDNIKKEKKQ